MIILAFSGLHGLYKNISLSTAQVIASAMGSVPNVTNGNRLGLRVSLRHLSYNTIFGQSPARRFRRRIVFPNTVYSHIILLLETLASPHENTWHHRGGPITLTINHFCINHNNWRCVEHTWKILISCIEKGVNYTGKNVTKKYGRPYLLSSSSEINLLANSMENCIGLRYTTLLINCHPNTHGENKVSRSTFNLAFRRLQPKKNQEYTTKNEE